MDASSSSSSLDSVAELEYFSKASSTSSFSSSSKGLSKHFKGKSQSFTSFSDVKTVEDLSKPENPFNAKMRQQRESRRFSAGCKDSRGGDVERAPAHRDGLFAGGDIPRHKPPLRAQTLTAAHLSALLSGS